MLIEYAHHAGAPAGAVWSIAIPSIAGFMEHENRRDFVQAHRRSGYYNRLFPEMALVSPSRAVRAPDCVSRYLADIELASRIDCFDCRTRRYDDQLMQARLAYSAYLPFRPAWMQNKSMAM